MLREKLAASGKMSQSMKDSTSIHDEHLVARVSQRNRQSLDRGESLVMRLLQQILDLQESMSASQGAEEF